MCDDTKNCVDNSCNFYGGCIKGCISSINRNPFPLCNCMDNFYLDATNTCQSCNSSCYTCDYDLNTCLSCYNLTYFNISTYKCYNCVAPCKDCMNTTFCLDCIVK